MEYAYMGKSLEKVMKPDGSEVWELVELREAQPEPEPEPEVCKAVRKRKPSKPAEETPTSTFDF
jgi:hypothetical protein